MTATHLAIAPVLVALVAAVATLLAGRRAPAVSLLGGVAYAVAVALLFRRVAAAGPVVYRLSGWEPPFGIVLVADGLSAFMLGLAAAVSLGALAFSAWYVDADAGGSSYYPLYHLMLLGISGAFLTGDVFNLFVWFEVMLMASYVLVVFYGGPEHTRAALTYVVLNLIGSAVMLLAIGGLYATTGTLNMADLARRLSDPAAYDVAVGPVVGLSALLLAVFALKAGIVPFHFWVPGAYRAAPAPVTAMLAGVVKKVGVYAIVRLYFTVFAAASLPVSLPGISGRSVLAFYGPVLFVMAVASILLGGVGAIDRDDVDALLAYSSIGQVGFIVLPLAVAASVVDPDLRALAVAAALVYTLNHGIAKALLFLASGAIYAATGTTRLADLGGLSEHAPVLSGGFLVGGLALVGIPPLVGFFGKFYVLDAASRAGADLAVAVALVGAILTIAYVSRAWNRGFWGPPSGAVESSHGSVALTVVVVAFAVAVVALGIGFEPVLGAVDAATAAALDRGAYVDAVLGGGS